ncbi:DNA mismatch repair protein MutS, connector domain-containing protein [Artemisia annua]|uniref:DNA mismatch repair protein MutS, connector domain-containing protein n=1 Tax=Artemisia annua TaxID=35608 RepID=A0A2U1LJC5_ARTAN|nr:DNA mismatch repair protein MutS, connector domain-containing protein [Artemisia annua]
MTTKQPATDFVDSSEVCKFIKMKEYFKGSLNVWDRALDGVVHQDVAICALGGLANHLFRLKVRCFKAGNLRAFSYEWVESDYPLSLMGQVCKKFSYFVITYNAIS